MCQGHWEFEAPGGDWSRLEQPVSQVDRSHTYGGRLIFPKPVSVSGVFIMN